MPEKKMKYVTEYAKKKAVDLNFAKDKNLLKSFFLVNLIKFTLFPLSISLHIFYIKTNK